MNFRYKFSIVLIILGLISAIMSFGGKNSSSIPAEEILTILLKGEYVITPDELAGIVVEQDSGVRVVDVRNPDQYKNLSIPGAVNIDQDFPFHTRRITIEQGLYAGGQVGLLKCRYNNNQKKVRIRFGQPLNRSGSISFQVKISKAGLISR